MTDTPRSTPGARCAWAALAIGAVALYAPRLAGQTLPPVRLEVRLTSPASSGARAPIVQSRNLLSDDRWVSALRSGLPVRLHYRLEVWRSRDGWFDSFERQTQWDVVVRHEPLLDQYSLLTIVSGRGQERRYATLDALSAALGFSFQVNVGPTASGRYYYSTTLEISTLSDSDLDELRRFLEGDPEDPEGKDNTGDVLGRGATRLLLRIAGLPTLRLEARSGPFEVRP
ncbi:MAG TPA: DUF4390 domain-containing protein [Gemmatimonadales bacterium]